MPDIKNITELEFPMSLHDKIMRKLFFLKFRTPLLLVIIFSIVNLVNSGWHFLTKSFEMQTFNIFSAMIQQFELSSDYGQSFLTIMIENTPVNALIVFMINLVLIYYLINIFNYIKRSNQTLLNA